METLKQKYEFPKTLPYHKGDDFTLTDVNPEGYAFYETKTILGFRQGLEIAIAYRNKAEMDTNIKPLIEVKSLSGNTWGKGTWRIIEKNLIEERNKAVFEE